MQIMRKREKTIVPPKKPYTKKMFVNDSLLYMKGASGGFDKVEMHNLMVTKGNKLRRDGVSRKEVQELITEAKEKHKKWLGRNKEKK
jgi:ATP adenylyltransferase/5',5'''-P-1,P-4-tetraphosphate phosphorylase II